MNFKNERLKSPFQPAQKLQIDKQKASLPQENTSLNDSLSANMNTCIGDLKKMAIQNKEKRQGQQNQVKNQQQNLFRKQSESRSGAIKNERLSFVTSQDRLNQSKNLNLSLLQSYLTNSTQKQPGQSKSSLQMTQDRGDSSKRKSSMLSKYVTQDSSKAQNRNKEQKSQRQSSTQNSSRIARGNSASNISSSKRSNIHQSSKVNINHIAVQDQNNSMIGQKRYSNDALDNSIISAQNMIIKASQSYKNISSEKKKDYQPILRTNKFSSTNYHSNIPPVAQIIQTPSNNDRKVRYNSVKKQGNNQTTTNNKENSENTMAQRRQSMTKFQQNSNHNDSFQVSFFQMSSTQDQLKIQQQEKKSIANLVIKPSSSSMILDHQIKPVFQEKTNHIDIQEPRILDSKKLVSNIEMINEKTVQSGKAVTNETLKEQLSIKDKLKERNKAIQKSSIRYINLNSDGSQSPLVPDRTSKHNDNIEEIHYKFVQFHQRNRQALEEIEYTEETIVNMNLQTNNSISCQVDLFINEQIID